MSRESEASEASRLALEHVRRVQLARKVHSLTGALPLTVFVIFHAWQQAAVRFGRDALLARLNETSHGLLETVGVMCPLLVHALCGLWLSRRVEAGARGPGGSVTSTAIYASPAFRRFQALTGIAMALFLTLHVSAAWHPWVIAGRAFASYGALLDQTGTLLGAAAYVVGISATCVHVGQGFSAFVLRWWPRTSPVFARGGGTVLGLGLWLILIDELAVYATGAALM